jgi:beta-carotene 3-hydroxylase
VNHWYFRGLRKAHKIHHKHQGKHPGECYGMLWVPLHYFKQALRQNSSHQ